MHWVIGDVHGMLRPLSRLLDAIVARDKDAELIFAGDYVNRGPDSAKVIDLLLHLQRAVFLRGNHDDIFDLILCGEGFAPNAAEGSAIAAFQWFMQYGLDATFLSYGVDYDWLLQTAQDPSAVRMQHLKDMVPPEHRRFIHELPPVYQQDEFFVLHGHWSPMASCSPFDIAEQLMADVRLRQSAIWGRFETAEIQQDKQWGRRGFFGHTPVYSYFPDPRHAPMTPLKGPQVTLLDTAVALVHWGRLTAYCVEADDCIQVNRAGEIVEGPQS